MVQRDFCYWLRGYQDLVDSAPTQEQWNIIKEHLNQCFNYNDSMTLVGPQSSELTYTEKMYWGTGPNCKWELIKYSPCASC